MADTIQIDGNGNIIPHRDTQLQQASQERNRQAEKPLKQQIKRRRWTIAKNSISGLMNAVALVAAVEIATSPELHTGLKAGIVDLFSGEIQQGMSSSPRPALHPTR